MIFGSTIRRHGWPKMTLFMLDWLGVTLAAGSTLFLHYFAGLGEYDTAHSIDEYLLRVGLLYASFPILVMIFRQHMLYKPKVYTTGIMQFAQLSRALLINALVLIAVLFFVRHEWIMHSRTNLFLFTLLSLGFLSIFRIGLFRAFLLPAIAGIDVRRILLVGTNKDASSVLTQSLSRKGRPIEVVAVVDQNGTFTPAATGPLVMRNIPHFREFVRSNDIQEVVVAENDLPYEDVVRLISDASEEGIPIHLLSDHFKVLQERVTKSTSEFLYVTAASISNAVLGYYSTYIKRPLESLVATLGLIIISPFLFGISIFVKMGSRGPLFFYTDVVGKNGVIFRWYKFRTMYVGANDEIHREHVAQHIRIGSRPTGKLAQDSRVTPIGRWLRRHSLDELPQLWNVIKGDMSLVGPRPCLPYEYEEYENWHKERFAVRPGMTGLWQVSGRSAVSFNDMVILDLYYIHNVSLWLDVAILLRTASVVLTGRGGG